MRKWLPSAIIVLLLLSAFRGQNNDYREFLIDGYAQGTTYHIAYYASDSLVTGEDIAGLLQRFDKSVSLYDPQSLICRFNRSASGIEIDSRFKVLVAKALLIHRATGGLVDPTVKPLVDAWGFGVAKPVHNPDDALIKRLLPDVGAGKISLKGSYLSKSRPGVQLDLDGIAQGYSVDCLARLLEKHGVHNYLVELGGELRIKGSKPGNEKFSVGIEAINGDDINPEPVRRIIQPGDGAVTTSGNYRKHHIAGGREVSHLINPLTGYPLHNEMISVTVFARDAITADGYDNGFMAMGLKRTLNFLEKHDDMGAYIVYRKADGSVADTAAGIFQRILKEG